MDTKQKKRPPAKKKIAKPVAKPAAAPKKRPTPTKEEPKISSDVVYLPPKPFNRNRLALQLITIIAVVLAVFFSLTVYFKVGDFLAADGQSYIEVIGEQKYTEQEIIEASGIKPGDSLIFIGRTRVAGRVISALPYVKSVRIGIKLPNTVKIEVEEVDVTYAAKAVDSSWWLISADGKIVDQAVNGEENRHAKILGVQLDKPEIGKNAVAWQDPVPPTDENGNPVPVTVTAAERLNAVINIAGFLEQNRIIGKIESIDVNHLMDIQLWYGNQYQILLGNTEQLGVKIATMKAAVSQVEYDEGILDIRDPNNILFKEFT